MAKRKTNFDAFAQEDIEKGFEKEELISELEELKVETYNKKLSGEVNLVEEKFESKKYIKKIGWEILRIDLMAIEDFISNRKCSKQDVLKYALRYYIPQQFYDIAINKINKLDLEEKINNIKIDRAEKGLEIYNNEFKDSMCEVQNEYVDLKIRFSWHLAVIDDYALNEFKEYYGATKKQITTYALRLYLRQDNYDNASEMLRLMSKLGHFKF